jgi:hypothetical protein
MTDAVVFTRIRVASSPYLAAVARLTDNEAVATEMFLLFLSRYPTDVEKGHAIGHLSRSTTAAARNAAIEDLAWALVNKAEFIFSY